MIDPTDTTVDRSAHVEPMIAERLEKASPAELELAYREAMARALESQADVDLFVGPWQEVAEQRATELLDAGDGQAFDAFEDDRRAMEARVAGERARRHLNMVELVARDGTQFRTGTPVTFPYAFDQDRRRDLEPYGKRLEPAGRYITHLVDQGGFKQIGWETGDVSFRNPLVIEWASSTADPWGWKARLSYHFGNLTGAELSRAIRRQGFDAVVTIRSEWGEAAEIVDLRRLGGILVRVPT